MDNLSLIKYKSLRTFRRKSMESKPELILFEHNFLKLNIDEALNIVKDYIIKNNLIIVGGMAIDLALRTVGLNIYDDHDIPDYDVYSYDNLQHSQELVKILCKQKLPNVSMMSAIHNTTIRVKMSGYTVFDCTYVPQNVYDKIPTITNLGFNIVDPNYQKIDQYNSLSFLFDITGVSYNIFHRMQKDIDRNNLLVDNFNINDDIEFITTKSKLMKVALPLKLFTNNENASFDVYDADGLLKKINNINDYTPKGEGETYVETDFNFCLHGVAAYSFYYNEIKNILNKSKNKEAEDLFKQCNIADISIQKDNFEVYLPTNTNVILVNNNNKFADIMKTSKIKTKYNALLDIFPIRVVYDNGLEIFDLFGRLLSIKIGIIDGQNFVISNFTYLLSYFLAKYYFEDKQYLSYYYSLLNLMKINNMLDNVSILFNYDISTFGKSNYSEPYFYFLKNMKHMYETKQNSTDKPKSSYLMYPDCNSDIVFNYENSEFFNIDGKENSSMEYTNFSHLLN